MEKDPIKLSAPVKPVRLDKKMVDFSKYLSFVLRHSANEIGVHMDKEGFVDVVELMNTPKAKKYTFNDLKFVVDNNEKKRFELVEVEKDGNKSYKIRAVQGHTITGLDEESLFEEIKDPKEVPVAIHGTDYPAFSKFIRFQGLKRMARTHIRTIC